MTLRRPAGWVAVAVAAASACVENEQGTGCLPIAPESARVDRAKPRFSGPTRITNARFPVGELTQVLQLGHEGSQPLRVEVTRLPPTRTFIWDGQRVETGPPRSSPPSWAGASAGSRSTTSPGRRRVGLVLR